MWKKSNKKDNIHIELWKEIRELKHKINNIQNINATNNNIINNTTNNIIQLVEFGKEDLYKISDQIYKKKILINVSKAFLF